MTDIVVLSGGLSHEREISLQSGRRVSQALKHEGFNVVDCDINAAFIPLIKSLTSPVVIPMLHGGLGENGSLAEVLELLKVPFVGATSHASRLTFDKAIATTLVSNAGLAAPKQVSLPHDVFRDLGAQVMMESIVDMIGLPLMVKPATNGSALGCSKVSNISELPTALVKSFAYSTNSVIEEFIEGPELAIGIIDNGSDIQVLPPVEIRPISGIYDYEARYNAGTTRFIAPADLPEEVLEASCDLALTTHKLLGLRHISRIDLMVRNGIEPIFIEGNVAPGMTSTSLVPQGLAAADLKLSEVLISLIATVSN